MKRRIFLQNTLTAGAGLVLSPYIKTAATKKVIVLGAGISGLCCAYELMKAGHTVTVLEASGRYGGHVFTGRDGLSDGLYADYGADHITQPGYEHFFEYIEEFNLTAIPYPNAEGSEHSYDKDKLKVIDGKIYSADKLKEPAVLKGLGFNDREVEFLSQHPMYELPDFFVKKYLDKFTDPWQPFGVGYDDYDKIAIAEVYKKEGASPIALRFLGGKYTNALYFLWRLSIMYSRGIPPSEGETFHLKDGNEQLPIAFAKRLGNRVKLNHPVTAIRHSATGVTVSCRPFGRKQELALSADMLVNCISLPVFQSIPITPALSPAKQYVVNHLKYSSHPFYVFEAASKFWLEDGIPSINMEFEHPLISSIWVASEQSAKDASEGSNSVAGRSSNQVDTQRILLKAFGPSGFPPQQILAAFREVYPGKKDTIEQALTLDWSKDKYAPVCEMEPFAIGEMHKFWPQVLQPDGRIYFAGTYADNMSRGMESCLRSARRIAGEIDKL
ncbi:flavin monoamine oxidase family protein [Flavitalea flava]